MWGDRWWVDLFIPWNLLPVRLLHLMLLFLCPLCLSFASTIIWTRSRETRLLNEILVLETLHFRSKAGRWFYNSNTKLIKAILLDTLRRLHSSIDQLEPSHISLIGTRPWIQKWLWLHCLSHWVLSTGHNAKWCISIIWLDSAWILTEEVWEYMVYERHSGLDQAGCCFLFH